MGAEKRGSRIVHLSDNRLIHIHLIRTGPTLRICDGIDELSGLSIAPYCVEVVQDIVAWPFVQEGNVSKVRFEPHKALKCMTKSIWDAFSGVG